MLFLTWLGFQRVDCLATTLVEDHLDLEEENQSMRSFIGCAQSVVLAERAKKEEMAEGLSRAETYSNQLEDQIVSLRGQVNLLKSDMASSVEEAHQRQYKAETLGVERDDLLARLSQMERDAEELQKKAEELEKKNAEYATRLTDCEGKHREIAIRLGVAKGEKFKEKQDLSATKKVLKERHLHYLQLSEIIESNWQSEVAHILLNLHLPTPFEAELGALDSSSGLNS